MAKYDYESVEDADAVPSSSTGGSTGIDTLPEANTSSSRRFSFLGDKSPVKVIVAVLAILGLTAYVAHNSSPDVDVNVPDITADAVAMLGSSSPVTDCTFDECFASNCNHEVAPYTCLSHNGGPHGGCSSVPWLVPETCTKQCDLTNCDSLKIPKSTESCDVKCDHGTWCTGQKARLCGKAAPYQCVTGSSAFGCSSDPYLWTLKSSDATCSSCCNADKCA